MALRDSTFSSFGAKEKKKQKVRLPEGVENPVFKGGELTEVTLVTLDGRKIVARVGASYVFGVYAEDPTKKITITGRLHEMEFGNQQSNNPNPPYLNLTVYVPRLDKSGNPVTRADGKPDYHVRRLSVGGYHGGGLGQGELNLTSIKEAA